jgi:hypothetical protein
MKTALQKSSTILSSLRELILQITESFESPQTRQFRRLKKFVSE